MYTFAAIGGKRFRNPVRPLAAIISSYRYWVHVLGILMPASIGLIQHRVSVYPIAATNRPLVEDSPTDRRCPSGMVTTAGLPAHHPEPPIPTNVSRWVCPGCRTGDLDRTHRHLSDCLRAMGWSLPVHRLQPHCTTGIGTCQGQLSGDFLWICRRLSTGRSSRHPIDRSHGCWMDVASVTCWCRRVGVCVCVLVCCSFARSLVR